MKKTYIQPEVSFKNMVVTEILAGSLETGEPYTNGEHTGRSKDFNLWDEDED